MKNSTVRAVLAKSKCVSVATPITSTSAFSRGWWLHKYDCHLRQRRELGEFDLRSFNGRFAKGATSIDVVEDAQHSFLSLIAFGIFSIFELIPRIALTLLGRTAPKLQPFFSHFFIGRMVVQPASGIFAGLSSAQ